MNAPVDDPQAADAADAAELQLAHEPLDEVDDAVLEQLAEAWTASDPVPPGLVERIQFELTLDALHAEVATLTQLDLAASGARSGAGAASSTEAVRTITFTAEALTAMVTLSPQADGTVRVDGWIAPGAGMLVEVLLADGARRTHADDDGRFVVEALPAGLAKFALHGSDSSGDPHTVVSPTIEL